MRSYAHVLLRWWRFLQAIGVGWDRATPAECRDFVLWLQQARKPISDRRTRSAAQVGTLNPVTRKQHLTDQYAPRTVRHSNAVLRAFYEFWIEEGAGPLVNPVPVDLGRSGRAHAHHNPMQPFRAEGRLRFNPTVPRRRPRAMPDLRWDELFGAMTSDRDRAILVLAVSTAARAGELIGLRGGDVTGVSSSSGSGARAATSSSGWRPVRTRSCGCGSTWPGYRRSRRPIRCGGRCGNAAACRVGGCR